MSTVLLAEFARPEAMLAAARTAKQSRCRLLDAFSPFPIAGVAETLDWVPRGMRVYMFFGGVAFAAAAYGAEIWSAVFDYPIDSGGRPLHSWPAFLLFPFALGIFGAALTGFITLLVQTGLPRLHHPLFNAEGFERATQDRFMLALEPASSTEERMQATAWLKQAGAVRIVELNM